MKKFPLLFLIGILTLARAVSAAVPSIQATVDKRTVDLEDTLALTITVRGDGSMSTPDIPPRGNFDVVGRSVGTNIEFINGELSATKTFAYTLAPRQTGDFTIGPIKVFIDGVEYSTGPIAVRVVEGRGGGTYRPQPPIGGAPQFPQFPQFPRMPGIPRFPFPADPDDFPQPQAPMPQTPPSETRDTFITVETDKKEAYVGEQVLFTFRMYSAVSVQGAQLTLPDFKDFITEELVKERKYEVDHGGRRYKVNEWRLAIFPTKAGSLTTGKTEVKASVPVRMGGGFDDPFFSGMALSYRPKTFTGESLTVEAKPLPAAPPDFTGLVGKFNMSSSLSKEQLDLGETANWKIEISGKGNVREGTLPSWNAPKNLKVYPDQPAVKMEKTISGLEGKKTFNYALVAERPGTVQLPGLEFSYFEPETGRFEKLSSPPIALAIRGSPTQEQMVSAGIQAGTSPLGNVIPKRPRDLQPIAEIPAVLVSQVSAPWEQQVAWVLFIGSPAAYLLLWGYGKYRERSESRSEDRKRSRAFRKAKGTLLHLRTGGGGEGFGEISQILREYIGDRFAVAGKALTPLEIEELLKKRKMTPETIRKMIYLLEQLDQWKYGGLHASLPPDKELKAEVLEILREVEKAA